MTHDLKLKISAKYKKYALQRLGQNSKEQMILVAVFHCPVPIIIFILLNAECGRTALLKFFVDGFY
jgi:hypothetical protein